MALELPDYNLSEERLEFRDSLRRFFEEHAPMTEVRRVSVSEGGISRDLWKRACDDLGLAGIAIGEDHGGQGFGMKELSIAFAEAGRALAPIPLLASAGLAGRVVASVLERGSDAAAANRWLAPIAGGHVATLAWLEASAVWDPAGVEMRARPEGDHFRLDGEKHFVLDAPSAERIFVVARAPGSAGEEGLGLFAVEAVDAGSSGMRIEARQSFDVTRGVGTIVFEDVKAQAVGSADAGRALNRGLDEATALLCAEMVGGMQKVLETAVDHASSRHQFGRPIGSFQAVKHKCADMLIDFEGARTAVDAAVEAIDAGDAETSSLTSVAKAHVGPAYVRMTTDNIQVHGGVGYTWEYDAHLFFRRARSSEILLADAVEHRARLAQALGGTSARTLGSGSARRADTPGEAAFRAEARAWLEANASLRTGAGDWSMGPVDHSIEAEREYWERMKAWQRTKFDGGWAAITWSAEHGGRGGTPVESIIFNEEESAFDVTSGFIDAAVGLIGPALIRFGTEAQRERYLKPMLRGDEIWCQLFSEPEAGSDLAAVRTRGVVDGDELVLNGQKLWTSSAQYADQGFIVCRTNPDVPKHQGISFALVDMRQQGVEVRPLVTMKGDRHFNEVFFEDVRTPLSNVVNGLDQGWPVTTFVLMNEGTFIGTGSTGRNRTLDLVAAAQASGRFEDPVVRERLAETYVEERVLELLQARLKGAVLDGRRPDVDGSVLKILWSEGGHRKAETANWLQGAHALLAGPDAPSGGHWQDQVLSRGTGTIGGGTSEVHRNGLGERALGLPREPRLDRDQPFKDLKIGC